MSLTILIVDAAGIERPATWRDEGLPRMPPPRCWGFYCDARPMAWVLNGWGRVVAVRCPACTRVHPWPASKGLTTKAASGMVPDVTSPCCRPLQGPYHAPSAQLGGVTLSERVQVRGAGLPADERRRRT